MTCKNYTGKCEKSSILRIIDITLLIILILTTTYYYIEGGYIKNEITVVEVCEGVPKMDNPAGNTLPRLNNDGMIIWEPYNNSKN